MKTYALLPIALLAALATAARPDPTPAELSEADRARIEREVGTFLAAYPGILRGEDDDAVRALFVTDERFAWFSDGEKRYRSADEVITSLRSMQGLAFSTEVMSIEILPLTVHLAHARTTFHTKLSQDEKVVYEFGGATTWILEEVEQGEWRVLTGHASTPKER